MREEEVSVFKFICYDLKNLVKAICSSIKETLTLIGNWCCIFGLYVYLLNNFTSMNKDVFNSIGWLVICYYLLLLLFKPLRCGLLYYDLLMYFKELMINYGLIMVLRYSTNLKELAVAFFILRLSFFLIDILVDVFIKIYKYNKSYIVDERFINGGVKILKKWKVTSKNKQWAHKGGGYL